MPALMKLLMLLLLGALGPARNDGFRSEAPSSGGAAPNVVLTVPEGFVSSQDPIALIGDTHGDDRREIHGQPCAEGYARSFPVAMMTGSGACAVEGWASDDPKDCRVWVHLRQGPLQSGTCTVTVYEAPTP